MTASVERVYFIGGTGNSGAPAVKELLKNKVPVTLYARSPAKAQKLFGDDPNLTVIEGVFADLKPFEDSIAGHTRLFLVVAAGFENRFKYKVEIAQMAYAAGVKQIVHVSSISASSPWRTSMVADVHRTNEERIANIPNRGAYVVLRPAHFMSNLLWMEASDIKANTIVDVVDPELGQPWISNTDIGLVAANILQDPVEKHMDAVYEMVGEMVNRKDRAELLSQALGRKITYVQATPEETYESLVKKGFPHLLAYEMLTDAPGTMPDKASSMLSVLLKRKPETLAQWLEANKTALIEATKPE